jgi:hypothetical protein
MTTFFYFVLILGLLKIIQEIISLFLNLQAYEEIAIETARLQETENRIANYLILCGGILFFMWLL